MAGMGIATYGTANREEFDDQEDIADFIARTNQEMARRKQEHSARLKKLTSKFEKQLAKDRQQLADDKEQLAKGKEQLAKFKEQLAKDEEKLVNYKARVDDQMVEVCKEHEMLTKQLLLLNREKAEVGGGIYRNSDRGKREGNLPATQNPKLELNMLGID